VEHAPVRKNQISIPQNELLFHVSGLTLFRDFGTDGHDADPVVQEALGIEP
jgi:hypothetical protein